MQSSNPESILRLINSPRRVFQLPSAFSLIGKRVFGTFALLLGSLSCLHASGIFWSDAELTEWKRRAVSGPYKAAGDAFDPAIPGQWNRIESSAAQFRQNPSSDRKNDITIFSSGNGVPVTNHLVMLDAALYVLVKEDAALASQIRNELLWHARNAKLQVSRDVRFKTDTGNWWKAAWLARLTVITDLVRGYLSPSDFSEITEWLADWAYAYEGSVHEEIVGKAFPNRYQRDYSTKLNFTAQQPYFDSKYAYKDGSGKKHNQIAWLHKLYNNRKMDEVRFFGYVGALTNDAVLMDRAKIFIEEWLKYSVFPDGSVGEYERNNISGNIQQGLIYNGHNVGAAVGLADAFARLGDTSLYEFSTRDGLWGTESGAGEPAKDIKLLVDTYFDLIEGKKVWYFDRGDLIPEHRIDNTSETGFGPGMQYLSELFFALKGNTYWKDSRIKDSYMRRASGSFPYGNKLGVAGPYGPPWRGIIASFPSALFMFAEMEHIDIPNGSTGSPDFDEPEVGDGSVTEEPVSDEPDGGSDVGADLTEGYREATVNGVKVFGFDPSWSTVGKFEKAYDGDSSTFYDYYTSTPVFTGIDLGEAKVVSTIRFHPRKSYAHRMVGGVFQGSNESSTSGYVTLHEVTQSPEYREHIIELSGDQAYRYYRYLATNGSYGNIAEFAVDVAAPTTEPEGDTTDDVVDFPNGYREATVNGLKVFGFDPAWLPGHEFEKAYDGRIETFYDYHSSVPVYTGIDLGESKVPAAIRFHPRKDVEFRMTGGVFQGSNESSTSGYVTLYEITEHPEYKEHVIELSDTQSYRYYRYVAPKNSYGNIAEFSIDLAVSGEPTESTVDFGLVYSQTYNASEYTGVDGIVLDAPVYVAVQPVDYVQSVEFYHRYGDTDILVNSESYAPFDFIAENTALSAANLEGGSMTIVAIVTDLSGVEHRLEATVHAPESDSVVDSENPNPDGSDPEVDAPTEDTDRLPDDWEIEHFGDTFAKNGGETEDFDGDGQSNYDEWLAGTDPTDVHDLLQLEPVIGVAWQSVSGRSYAIEFSDDNWSTVETSEPVSGTGDEMVWLDSESRDVIGNRQYRIVVNN